jgi:hypothetical protein
MGAKLMDQASIKRINKICEAVAQSLRPAERTEDIKLPVPGEIQKEQEPQGWSLSPIDPAAALKHLPHLKLKKGWRLVGYQFVSGGNGNGVVHAVPESSTFDLSSCLPEDKEVVPGVVLATPRPAGCAESFMDAIESDGSDEAYVQASLLYRELEEFGARWHGCSWGAHTILLDDPWSQKVKAGIQDISDQSDWKFHKPKPASWEPTVKRDGKTITVSFFTFSALGQEAVYLHHDTYQGTSMTPEAGQELLASGRLGYIH